MFDMEKQIESWRATVSGALGKRGDAIDELEGHLRDDLEKLAREGRSPEQAWEEAMKHLGTPEQLASEFDKTRSQKWLAAWWAVGGWRSWGRLAGWLALRLPHRRGDLLLAVHVFAVTTGYSAVFAVGFLSLWATIWQALRGWDASRDAALRGHRCAAGAAGGDRHRPRGGPGKLVGTRSPGPLVGLGCARAGRGGGHGVERRAASRFPRPRDNATAAPAGSDREPGGRAGVVRAGAGRHQPRVRFLDDRHVAGGIHGKSNHCALRCNIMVPAESGDGVRSIF